MAKLTGSLPPLFLASQSPRRRDLLEQLGLHFSVYVPQVEELVAPRKRGARSPEAIVKQIAEQKARHAAGELRGKGEKQGIVLAADTLVFLGRHVLGKPHSREAARDTLRRLSGREHTVATAAHLLHWDGARERAARVAVKTKVRFTRLSPRFLEWYLDSPEPWDKAGSYAAQGIAASFLASLKGSYSNVVGLPLPETLAALEKL
ncbi:MAG: septum formation protein Maf, partial [Bdellovibrionales bacterium]|nr:septum formation protein Maf [Bdellovibrionales bacterium]